MRDEKVSFSWLAEPVLGEAGPKLIHHDKAHWIELPTA
jgi:hypothetical protein